MTAHFPAPTIDPARVMQITAMLCLIEMSIEHNLEEQLLHALERSGLGQISAPKIMAPTLTLYGIKAASTTGTTNLLRAWGEKASAAIHATP